jgi:hypothetical protein
MMRFTLFSTSYAVAVENRKRKNNMLPYVLARQLLGMI